jgi:hypothetical protein
MSDFYVRKAEPIVKNPFFEKYFHPCRYLAPASSRSPATLYTATLVFRSYRCIALSYSHSRTTGYLTLLDSRLCRKINGQKKEDKEVVRY